MSTGRCKNKLPTHKIINVDFTNTNPWYKNKKDITVTVDLLLPELKKALLNYIEKTGRRITIEYILIHKFNDTQSVAKVLAHFLKDLKCNVNLIPYNSVIENDYK